MRRLWSTATIVAVTMAALAIGTAPAAAADGATQKCTNLNTSSTKCESPGDVEINDSLPYADVLPQWSEFGGQSGGPYGGPGGGAG